MPKTPAPARGATPRDDRHTICRQLRDVIESRGLTYTELGQLSGVDPTVISRFVAGERDLRFETAGKIAAACNLRLVEVEVARPRSRGPRAAT